MFMSLEESEAFRGAPQVSDGLTLDQFGKGLIEVNTDTDNKGKIKFIAVT
jgi:hypothetical protein